MKKSVLTLLALSALVLASCKKDDNGGGTPAITESVLIANEGVFQTGVGSIIAYQTGAKTTEKNIFQKANFIPPGNTLNQIYMDGDRAFLVVNGSGEVLMCDASTMKLQKRFTGLGQPRQICKAAPNKYYVSDWANNAVHVLNTATKEVTKLISMGVGPEAMVLIDGKVYVTNSGGFSSDSTIYALDVATDLIVDTITVGENPVALAQDKNGLLWIYNAGIPNWTNPANSTPASIMVYNLDSNEVVHEMFFTDVTKKPLRMSMNGQGSAIYYIDDYIGDVYRMSTTDSILPLTPFATGNFYGLGYDPVNNEVYTTDPKDFNSNGDVYRYTTEGKLVDQFEAGLIPATFGFR